MTARPGPLAVFAAASLACASPAGPGGGGGAGARLAVAVTIPPQAWLVEAVGGERVEVSTLVAPGQSAETYQPTDAEVSRALAARIYFRIGAPAEQGGWFRALERSGRARVVDLREGVEPLPAVAAANAHRHDHGGEHGEAGGPRGDPHVWLSPRRLAAQARSVAAALAEADPAGRAVYAERLARIEAVLAELDRDLAARLAPYAGRSFFVFHPSWEYFAADYGLEQVAVEREGKEPTDAELTRVLGRAREHGARVIFVQPQIPGRSAAAVARAVGARVETLDPLAADVPANLRAVAERLARSFAA